MNRRVRKEYRRGLAAWAGMAIFVAVALAAHFIPVEWTPGAAYPSTWLRDGERSFADYLRSVRSEGATLLLGTSETHPCLDGNNYGWVLGRRRRVEVFSGAGRNAALWEPAIRAYGEAFRGVRMLYYVNPIYWMPEHNRATTTYLYRYVSPFVAGRWFGPFSEAALAEERPIVQGLLALWPLGLPHRALIEGTHRLQLHWRAFRGEPSAAPSACRASAEAEVPPPTDWLPDVGVVAAKKAQRLPAPIAGGFQSEALRRFLRTARREGVRLTLVLGPHNRRLARVSGSDAAFEKLRGHLRALADEASVRAIDLEGLSDEPGIFVDFAHFTPYGGRRVGEHLDAKMEAR